MGVGDVWQDGGPFERTARSMTWNEGRLLDWIATWTRPGPLVGSRGHDAAVLGTNGARTVWCTDQAAVGVHVAESVPPGRLGAKAIARTASDLAATAAEPVACLVALRAPAEVGERWIRAALDGARRRADELGLPIVGGDLAQVPGPASLAVAAHGSLAGRRRPPGRDRAAAGQVLVATGAFGGSALGRHLAIEPRLAAGRALWEAGATALMDVSDGLGIDADRLARASGVELVLEDVPIHPDARRAARRSERTALDHALEDGEDHELLATLPRAAARRLASIGIQIIGHVRAAERSGGLVLASESGGRGGPWRGRGFVHGTDDGPAAR